MGFTIRKRDLSRDEDGNLNRRYYVFNRQGTRDPKHYRLVDGKRNYKPETRTGYKARCSLNEADKAQIVYMKEYGFQTSQIVGILAKLVGGYGNLNFTKKDVYNFIDRDRCAKIEHKDAAAVVAYLQSKADVDPMFVARYTLLSTPLIRRIDIINLIFSGSNNHCLTCIFGFLVLANETRDTYTWLLKEFLDVMMNKEPSVVVTDDDDQMRQAIKEVSIYPNMTVPQFKAYWEEMIQKFDIGEDHWLLTKYANKEMWATIYLRGKFSASVRTTSRCEDYRNNELVTQFKSMYSKPLLTTGLDSIEQAAAMVYTAELFAEVEDQLAKVAALKHVGKSGMGSNVVHCVAKFRRPGRLYHVLHDVTSERIECECHRWKQSDIPCNHKGVDTSTL
ncbi:protein FAR1-RELATED SEQUENCE 3-like [Arachis ipaensis]|nr:protein FAR1-RELATED SEQUENCE 3-like [Arachis ipaensis]RYQ83346.1 hypothetical protein Ahy_B10g101987 isoform A [Arachis hypogaea]